MSRRAFVCAFAASSGFALVVACTSFSGDPATPLADARPPSNLDERDAALACDAAVCDGQCVPLGTLENCGACGDTCSPEQFCWGGRCRNAEPSGCSDGKRDAFLDAAVFTEIAGCYVAFERTSSLRMPRSAPDASCGFELERPCKSPADACARGWHVCGIPPFGAEDLRSRLTAEQCNGEPGSFGNAALVAALGDQACEPCNTTMGKGAVCCGKSCVQQKGSCVYPDATAWYGAYASVAQLCAAISMKTAESGVLCCLDPDPDAGR